MFWMAFLVSLALTVVGELIRPKTKPPNAVASGLDDFDLPTAEEGRSVTIMCGKVKLTGANVTAYGDLETEALTKKVKTGLFSSTRQTYAHKYYLGLQMTLAHGEVDIHEIRFGDSMPSHTRTDEGNGCIRFDFNDENFFGGNEKEGGISGTLRFYKGTDTQTESAYLATLTGESAPAYTNIAHAILEKMYLGTSTYIKPVSYIVSRYPNTLNVTGGAHVIGEDANPICFIYEILTSQTWGVGLQASDIDLVGFRQVAQTIADEGYGVSLIYNGQTSAREIIADILRHIDGVIFSHPQTGLVSVRLARKDYNVDDLPVYGPEHFDLSGIKFGRPSWSDTRNTVKVSYVDRDADYSTAIIMQRDMANVAQRNGQVAVEDLDFTGFSTYAPAAMATARALKTYATPLARMSGNLDRRAWRTIPGDCFVLNWPELGIERVVFRVNSVTYGGVESNVIAIEAIEDIFSITDVAYTQPPPSGWVNPLRPPETMLTEYATDMPYGMEPVEGSLVATFGMRSGGMDEGYTVVSDRTSPYTLLEERARVSAFTPFATLDEAFPATAAAVEADGFAITGLRGTPDVGSTEFALIVSAAGQEWVSYNTISGGRVRNVTRGVFDTAPKSHPAGARVYFASSGYGVENDGTPYTVPTTLHVKLLPFNPRGQVAQDDASTIVVSTSQRGSRPIVPGRVRLGGSYPTSGSSASGVLSLTWAPRNRLHPVLLTQDDAGVDPEAGTTYNVRAYRVDTGALLASGSGNLPAASVALAYTGDVRVEIEAQRGSLVSYDKQQFILDYAPAGVTSSVITVDSAEYILDGGGA